MKNNKRDAKKKATLWQRLVENNKTPTNVGKVDLKKFVHPVPKEKK